MITGIPVGVTGFGGSCRPFDLWPVSLTLKQILTRGERGGAVKQVRAGLINTLQMRPHHYIAASSKRDLADGV